MRRSCTRPGFSLMELMIVILLISVFLTAINYFLRSIVRWERTSYAQNELAEDIARVWTELGADFRSYLKILDDIKLLAANKM